jgi:hypothetical protein
VTEGRHRHDDILLKDLAAKQLIGGELALP